MQVAARKHPRRVLWLLNHTTLMEAEVPLLRELGFEVFTPKRINDSIECRTAFVDYQHDDSLTIPADDLNRLNGFNFYQEFWPDDIIELVNRYFCVVITSCIIAPAYNIARFFTGNIFLRVFGVAGTLNYEAITDYALPQIDSLENKSYKHKRGINYHLQGATSLLGRKLALRHRNHLTKWLYLARRRVFLAASYQQVIENELPFFKQRSKFLPLGLPASLLEHEDTWVGHDPRVLFVCPNLNQIQYYRAIYDDFKSHMQGLPYYIAGRQDLQGSNLENIVEDEGILGFQPREQYNRLLRECRVMFYHSQEPRHLHYHPLEAVLWGMPLIFMAGGLLESLASTKLPGLCQTKEEARAKLERVLNGDQAFTAAVLQSQKCLLREFRSDFVRSEWEKNFLPVVRAA